MRNNFFLFSHKAIDLLGMMIVKVKIKSLQTRIFKNPIRLKKAICEFILILVKFPTEKVLIHYSFLTPDRYDLCCSKELCLNYFSSHIISIF